MFENYHTHGFKYRKKKRRTAHAILGVFVSSVTKVSEFKNLGKKFNQRGYSNFTISELEDKLNVNDSDLLYSSVSLLKQNIHLEDKINPIPNKEFDMLLGLTLKGEDAFKSKFYIVENRRDRLEQWELITKWILPILGVLISIIALIISGLNSCNSNKQPSPTTQQIIITLPPEQKIENKKSNQSKTDSLLPKK